MIQIYAFLQAHQMALSAIAVAILDFLVEIHPGIEHNNIVSLLLGFFKKPPTPPSA